MKNDLVAVIKTKTALRKLEYIHKLQLNMKLESSLRAIETMV